VSTGRRQCHQGNLLDPGEPPTKTCSSAVLRGCDSGVTSWSLAASRCATSGNDTLGANEAPRAAIHSAISAANSKGLTADSHAKSQFGFAGLMNSGVDTRELPKDPAAIATAPRPLAHRTASNCRAVGSNQSVAARGAMKPSWLIRSFYSSEWRR